MMNYRQWAYGVASRYGLLILILMVTVAVANILAPNVLSPQNLSTMVTFGVEIGLMAFGETFVILGGGGGIDLSVGSMFALSQVIAGVLAGRHFNLWLAVVASLLSGATMGWFNGWVITRLRVPAIITTLATMYAYSGIALLLSGGIDISRFPNSYAIFGQGTIFGVPFQFLAIYVPAAAILWFVLTKTLYGQYVYLTGTNQLAATLSGIDVKRVRHWAYVVTGLLSAIAAIVNSSRLATARPDAGGTANLAAITIAVLGGTSIFGGKGSLGGTCLATLVITLLSYSCSLANINSVIETGVVGLLLVVVMLGQNVLTRAIERRGGSIGG